MRCGSTFGSNHLTPLVGIRSPKSVLMQLTPKSYKLSRHPSNHLTASGFVKSTKPMPACQRSHCQTSPFSRFKRYPFSAASAKIGEAWPTYGFVQTEILLTRLADLRRLIWPAGSGKYLESKTKSHQWKERSQKQS